MKRRSSRITLAFAVIVLVGLGGGCAPRLARPPELDATARASRYRAVLAERRARGVAVTASLVLWLERTSERRLPGAQADLLLAAPDRVRLRVASSFGTALDLGARGDSLLAYVPAWRSGLRLGSVRDSLGVREPGDLAYRLFSATWDPPAEAWTRGVWRDSLLQVAWAEGGDSLALAVGRDGLPAWVLLGGAGAWRARYRAWDRSAAVAWPAQLEIEDDVHGARLTCKASRLRFRPAADTTRLSVRVPGDAAMLTLAELRAVLGRLGVY